MKIRFQLRSFRYPFLGFVFWLDCLWMEYGDTPILRCRSFLGAFVYYLGTDAPQLSPRRARRQSSLLRSVRLPSPEYQMVLQLHIRTTHILLQYMFWISVARRWEWKRFRVDRCGWVRLEAGWQNIKNASRRKAKNNHWLQIDIWGKGFTIFDGFAWDLTALRAEKKCGCV